MNWYKQAQQSQWSWGNFFATFGPTVIAGLLALNQMGLLDLQKAFAKNPQQVVQEAKQVQVEQSNVNEENQVLELQKNNIPETNKVVQKTPGLKEEKVVNDNQQSTEINLDKIWQIESTRGTDPDAMNPNRKGALGHFQFLKGTWNECVSMMGKNWDWRTGALDYNKSKAVADFYLNKRIPQMLKHYSLPDNIKFRLAAYDWGIGNVKKVWEKYGEDWENHLPQETIEYFAKYGV